MTEHFTKNTVEASAWCAKCKRKTMHRVDADAQQGRLGPCLVCVALLEAKHKVQLPPGFCACGRTAVALCDWKLTSTKSGLCDRPICAQHAKQVAPGKHLCPEHQLEYDLWKKRHPSPQGELFAEAS